LGVVEVRGRPHQFDVPEIQHPLEARLGDGVLFLGYDMGSDDVKPGDTLELILYWQALQELQVSYTVFAHLLDVKNQIWGQIDSIPGRGDAPTTGWIPGETITDEYQLVVDPEAPPAEYIIEIGMYDANTGERLPAYGGTEESVGDRILLGHVQLVDNQ
jgi:hypothetical protein